MAALVLVQEHLAPGAEQAALASATVNLFQIEKTTTCACKPTGLAEQSLSMRDGRLHKLSEISLVVWRGRSGTQLPVLERSSSWPYAMQRLNIWEQEWTRQGQDAALRMRVRAI